MTGSGSSECVCNVNSGDTAWMLTSSLLVLGMMPALGFFEAGLSSRKNAVSILTQITSGMALLQMLWHMVGFTLSFGPDQGGFIGNFDHAFFMHLSATECSCFAEGIPALLFAIFEAMFALIAPLLMTGAFVGHMRFFFFLLFIVLWEVLVYYPVAHWVWGGGWLYQLGVHDFAGGIVLHTTAGSSSLAVALALGRRADYAEHHGEETPHNIPLSNIGAALLWMGWYGFNGGSAFGANAVAVNAVATTTIASCGASLIWLICAVLRHRSVDSLVLFNGAIAGLAGITPCSGYVSPAWATLIATVLGLISYGSVWLLKEKLKIDDALDVSSLHGITGMVGSMLVGIMASTKVNPDGPSGWIESGDGTVFGYQVLAVVVVAAWSMFWTFLIILGALRISKWRGAHWVAASTRKQLAGLDKSDHHCFAYAADFIPGPGDFAGVSPILRRRSAREPDEPRHFYDVRRRRPQETDPLVVNEVHLSTDNLHDFDESP